MVLRPRLPALVLALAVGCNGFIGDPGLGVGESKRVDPERPIACDLGVPQVSPQPLRRLTPLQYRNTVRDLMGDAGFTPDVDDDAPVLTERGLRQLRTAAELVVERRAQWTQAVFPCDTGGGADAACAAEFLDGFGARAFRRPLTDDDREWLMGVFGDASAELSFREAMDVLLQVVLSSPSFLYLHEEGEAVDGVPDHTRRLTDHELASRLSYFLWDTMPDDALRAAAAAGELTSGDLRGQATRLLDDPRAEAKVQRFVWEWLKLDGGRLHFALEESNKDADLFPEYDAALQTAMRTELEAHVRRTYFEGDPTFDALLTDRRAWVNGPLASLYGVTGGPADADTWEWVDLDPAERSGLLTRAAFLTVFASSDVQTPIRRGVFVIEEVLCNELGEPPPNVNDTPVSGGEVVDETGATVVRSVREDVAARTRGNPCNNCHQQINPTGFAFEHYDAIGRHQDVEITSGRPIDSTGELFDSDVDGPVADALEMSRRLAASDQVRGCFAERWITRATGQAPGPLDECSVEDVQRHFRETGNVRDLLLSIVESDAFRYVNVGEVAGE